MICHKTLDINSSVTGARAAPNTAGSNYPGSYGVPLWGRCPIREVHPQG